MREVGEMYVQDTGNTPQGHTLTREISVNGAARRTIHFNQILLLIS